MDSGAAEKEVRRGPPAAALVVLATAVLATLIVTTALFVIGQSADRKFLRNYRAPFDVEAYLVSAIEYATQSSDMNDVLFFGDSTCMSGLDPVEVQRLNGLRSYSLATNGLVGQEGFLLILQTYLKHHPQPRLVVLCQNPWDLCVPQNRLNKYRTRFLSIYGEGQRSAPSFTMSDMGSFVRSGVWSLYGEATGGLAARLAEPVPGRGMETLDSLRKALRVGRGYWPEYRTIDPAAPRRPKNGKPFSVAPEVASSFEAIASFCEKNGVPLMIRLTPELDSGVGEQFFDPLLTFLGSLEKSHPGLTVSRPPVLRYSPAEFADELHMNPSGAARFTALVAGEVARTVRSDVREPRQ